MARSSSNSLLYSLRGIIWISTSVLAFFICTFGLISYLLITLLTNNALYGVFIPFLFLAFIVIIFGWWLSNELVNPIEKVTLLSKSLERNSLTSLPKTSGSRETDQLLQTLQKNSQQMQNIATLFDKVANGNLDVTLTPLKGSDRLTSSFQKLLKKVSESIHAKDQLTALENSIGQLKEEISGITSGNLVVDIRTDNNQTKELAETYQYLLDKLTLLISITKVDAHQAQHSARDVKQILENIVQQDELSIQEMNQASIALKQVPNLIERISKELTNSSQSAQQTIDKTQQGTLISQDNSESVSQLRIKLRNAVNQIQNLNERSHEIAKVAKAVEDLANRTNMIALNASIQATEFGEEGRSFVLVSEELERLATRANGTNKQISQLNNSILSEIAKVEESLDTTMGEVAELSKFAIETGNILSELERNVGTFLNLQDNLIALSRDQSEDTNEAFETFISSISNSENTIKNLKNSSEQIQKIQLMMSNLQMHTSEFKVISHQTHPANSAIQKPFETKESTKEDELYEEFASQEFGTNEFQAARLNTEEFEEMTAESENFDSESLNADELNIKDMESDKFDSDELNLAEFTSDKFDKEELRNMKIDPNSPVPVFDSTELFHDDLEIEEQKPELELSLESESEDLSEFRDSPEIEDEALSEAHVSHIPNPVVEDDDILNLNDDSSRNQNLSL
jgi:twitching motility protein PilJ